MKQIVRKNGSGANLLTEEQFIQIIWRGHDLNLNGWEIESKYNFFVFVVEALRASGCSEISVYRLMECIQSHV